MGSQERWKLMSDHADSSSPDPWAFQPGGKKSARKRKHEKEFCLLQESLEHLWTEGVCEWLLEHEQEQTATKRLSKKAKRKYCSKVSCLTTTECVCPMALDPVCNSEGHQVADNEDCAICQGEDPENLFPCEVTLEPGVF